MSGTVDVLILVLMEDTLGVKKSSGRRSKKVLILVLMEDTLGDKVMNAMNNFSVS